MTYRPLWVSSYLTVFDMFRLAERHAFTPIRSITGGHLFPSRRRHYKYFVCDLNNTIVANSAELGYTGCSLSITPRALSHVASGPSVHEVRRATILLPTRPSPVDAPAKPQRRLGCFCR